MTASVILNTQTIITIASLLTAVIAIFTVVFKIHNWYLKQEKQDSDIKKLEEQHKADIKEIREEQRIICTGVLACLDGLEQLGCNHTVPKAKATLEQHINDVAHR